jgi:hypothetical protein
MKSNLFMTISMLMGVLAIFTCPLFFLSFPLAGLGILFAILSKGKHYHMEIMPKVGIITSAIGAALCTMLTTAMIALMLFSPSYRAQLNQTSQALYGYSFDQLMQDSYGFTLEDVAARLQRH